MDIATNAILAAVLLEISSAVKPLGLPLETPLESSKVVYFHSGPESVGSDTLASVVIYKGGYRFWHAWGILSGLQSPDATIGLQDPRELDRLVGDVRYTEAQCLAKFKETLRALGHTNLAVLENPPTVKGPSKLAGKVVPRYRFEWSDPKGRLPDWMKVVRAEVNAEQLKVEYLWLSTQDFYRKGWPVTFGQTNLPPPPKSPLAVVRTELEVKDVSRDYAMALIHHIIPEIQDFGRKFGAPLTAPISESDIVMGESSVQMLRGKVWVSLRLKCGYLVDYWAGRIMTVHTPDIYSVTGAWEEERSRDTEEVRGPMRVTRAQAIEKVRRLVLDKFGLPEKPLYLDTMPEFYNSPVEGATNGIRRFVFGWHQPETEEQRRERISDRTMADISVMAEVDAVSGVIKLLSLMHPSLYRPDPKIDVPINPSAER